MATKTAEAIALHDTVTGLRRVEALLGGMHGYMCGTTDRDQAITCALHEAAEKEVANLLGRFTTTTNTNREK